jgi:phosphoribosylanthranilate isomerase
LESAVNEPKVKICGVTRVEDAVAAVELGASLLGLNFWPGSPRFLDVRRASEIAAAVRGRALLVGVFVNQPEQAIRRADQEVGLDLLQLHGDEGPADAAPFGGRAIKAFRVAERFDGALLAGYPSCWGFVFDRLRPGAYGGTGEGWRYEEVRDLPTRRPVLVAGGVTPETVGQVVARCTPWGVDVCSGVETAPGVKSSELMKQLFEEIEEMRNGQETATA